VLHRQRCEIVKTRFVRSSQLGSIHQQISNGSGAHTAIGIAPAHAKRTVLRSANMPLIIVCGARLLSSSPTARYRASDWYRITHISGWVGRVSGARETVSVSNRLTFFSSFRKALSSSMDQAAVTGVL